MVTAIRAPIDRCFDLSRDLDLHVRSMGSSHERAIAGRTSGLIGPGEEVTWRARHFGLWHEHRSRITGYDRPRWFRDEMVEGRFRRFVHDHGFEERDGVTGMTDTLEFDSPAGGIIDRVLLAPYLRGLLRRRNDAIRLEAEAQPQAPK